MPMIPSSIAIGIVSFERGVQTAQCIDSIRKHTPAGSYHVYLADNASRSAETLSMLQSMAGAPDVTVIKLDSNFGPSRARNEILHRLPKNYRMVALLDNDIVALPGWSTAAAKCMDEGADLIQPKLLTADLRQLERGPTVERKNSFAANPEYIGVGLPPTDPRVNIAGETAIVGSGIVRTEVFERIGQFDERLHVGEDFDLSLRARQAGFNLRYSPDCELVHDHGFDLEYDSERGKVEKYLTSHVVYWRKHGKAILSPQYLRWYTWLLSHAEPMYLPSPGKWSQVPRRLRRRQARWLAMHLEPQNWKNFEEADRVTEALASTLGLQHEAAAVRHDS